MTTPDSLAYGVGMVRDIALTAAAVLVIATALRWHIRAQITFQSRSRRDDISTLEHLIRLAHAAALNSSADDRESRNADRSEGPIGDRTVESLDRMFPDWRALARRAFAPRVRGRPQSAEAIDPESLVRASILSHALAKPPSDTMDRLFDAVVLDRPIGREWTRVEDGPFEIRSEIDASHVGPSS